MDKIIYIITYNKIYIKYHINIIHKQIFFAYYTYRYENLLIRIN